MNKMIKLIVGAALFVTPLSVVNVTPAFADNRCEDVGTAACELFKKQQNAPKIDGPKIKAKEPMRCVQVVSGEATALVLRAGAGVNGDSITSWRRAAIGWKDGKVKGRAVKIAQVCFPTEYLYAYDAVTLCGEVGHSIWRNKNMEYVRKNNITKFDPACVGGTGWCKYRGL